ncbi:MAG: MarR family transcriptional regulator [Erythrobacter sp.]
MSQNNSTPNFVYDCPSDSAGLPVSVAVFADNQEKCDRIAEDLAGAGFRVTGGGLIATVLDDRINVLGDIVLIDCPLVDAQILAALARLDMRVARSSSQLIVSTSLEALDDVFAALDQSDPQLLVDPSRAERIVAVGRVLSNVSNARVRELADEDRITLLRLSQQVDAIAHKLEGLSDAAPQPVRDEAVQKLNESKGAFRGFDKSGEDWNENLTTRPTMPDPRLIRQIIANRQARSKFFGEELFADPAWDMLLDLTAAHAEHRRVSVTSLCIAAGVPATTALRWVRQMVDGGVFVRVADSTDRRRAFVALSDSSANAMANYFSEIGEPLSIAA